MFVLTVCISSSLHQTFSLSLLSSLAQAPAPVVTGSTTKPDNLSKKTAHLPSSSPSNSPPSSTPARTSTRKPFRGFPSEIITYVVFIFSFSLLLVPVQNDFVYLNYLRHDCIDKVSV